MYYSIGFLTHFNLRKSVKFVAFNFCIKKYGIYTDAKAAFINKHDYIYLIAGLTKTVQYVHSVNYVIMRN